MSRAANAVSAPVDVALIRQLGARAWMELNRLGIAPTPRNYEVWFMHLSGGNSDLSQNIRVLVREEPQPSAAALEALHSTYLAADPAPIEGILEGTEDIQQAAQDVVDSVAANAGGIRAYAETLTHWQGRIDQDRTVEGLLQAVSVLSAETARAGERNRVLERQLSTSAARIGKLKDNLAGVKREATTDPLTGLCNRRAFDARLRRMMGQSKAEGGSLSVVLLDVDHFKAVNDKYGHPAGDLVLRLVGRLLIDSVKGRDTAARYGGEEFALVLAGADLRAAAIVAGQVRGALDGKRLVNKVSGNDAGSVTISAGAAEFRPGDTAATLLGRADTALYRAKHSGRNRVCTEADENSDVCVPSRSNVKP